MKTIGIREFRDRLTAHVREILKGRSFFLTSRGKPIAVLRPIVAADLIDGDPGMALEALAAEGKIRRGSGTVGTRVLHPRSGGTPLSKIVIGSRR
jgi:antitoxin (DNA-binding transcriptional repressor) of toxin-antitoxin stability system